MTSNALKGVLAVAGYQNRDKITEILRGLRTPSQPGPNGDQSGGGLGGLLGGLGGLGGLFSGGAAGGGLSGGLGDLLRQFEQKGHGETAKSWVEPGSNKEIDDRQLSEVLGPEVLEDLSQRTGLSAEEILSRLSRDLPAAVDDMTPDGKIPTESDETETAGHSSVPSIKPEIV